MKKFNHQMKNQDRVMERIGNGQRRLEKQLRDQKDKQKKLIQRIKGDMETITKYRGNRVLMLNDGNISLPVKDWFRVQKMFDEYERERRKETLELLNRYGESVVSYVD